MEDTCCPICGGVFYVRRDGMVRNHAPGGVRRRPVGQRPERRQVTQK